jgi:hypothetical protein
VRQRPLLLGPSVGELRREEPAVRDEDVAVDAERDGEAVLGGEGEADVGGVGVVELVPWAAAADELSDAVLQQHLAVHGAGRLQRVRLRRRRDGVDGARVVVLLVGHHVEERGAGARLVERQRRRGHGVEEPRVERGVELGVAGGVGRLRGVGRLLLRRGGVGGGGRGGGGRLVLRRVHGVGAGAGGGGGGVRRGAPGGGDVEGKGVGRGGGEIGERSGSGRRSGHMGLRSQGGWVGGQAGTGGGCRLLRPCWVGWALMQGTTERKGTDGSMPVTRLGVRMERHAGRYVVSDSYIGGCVRYGRRRVRMRVPPLRTLILTALPTEQQL